MPYKDKRKQREAVRRGSRKYRQKKRKQVQLWHKLAVQYLGGKCVGCGGHDNLHIHHCNGEWDDDSIDNLVLLCQKCHSAIHRSIFAPYSTPKDEERVKHAIAHHLMVRKVA